MLTDDEIERIRADARGRADRTAAEFTRDLATLQPWRPPGDAGLGALARAPRPQLLAPMQK